MKTSNCLLHVALLAAGLTAVSQPVQAADYVWSGSASGVSADWFASKNWKIAASTASIDKLSLAPGATEDAVLAAGSALRPSGVPGTGDTATLTAGAIVTTGAPLTLAKLTVEAGSALRSSASITVTSELAVRDAQLSGGGKLIIAEGATATFSSQQTGDSAGNIIGKAIENRGTLIKSGGKSTISLPFRNSGQIYLRSGLLDVGPKYTQTGGALHLDGGDLSSSGTVQIEGGEVGGTGTLNCDVVNSGGTLKPGHSPGIITINGNYTQTTGGTLGMEVGGTNPGTGYDQLEIWGRCNLGGLLDIVKWNNYNPYAGQSFDFIHCYEMYGNFTSFNGLYPGGYLYYKLIITPDSYMANVHSDNTPPTVSISNPVHNGSYLGVSSVHGVANDVTFASGVRSVAIVLYRYATSTTPSGHLLPNNTWSSTYSAANQLVASGTTNWNRALPTLTPGQYHVKATATDNVGRMAATSTLLFNVSSSGSSGYVSLPASRDKRLRLASLAANWKLRSPKGF